MLALRTCFLKRLFVQVLGEFTLIHKDQDGMTLIEVMIAILIFLIIMLGGMNFFFLPEATIMQEKKKRVAILAAHQRMEAVFALKYDQISASLNETGIEVKMGNLKALRKTTVTNIDDPADGIGIKDNDRDIVDYKKVIVEIYSFDEQNQKIRLSTKISKFGK